MGLKIKSGVALDALRPFGFSTGRELAAHGGDSGAYTAEERQRIDSARAWLRDKEQVKFTHVYIPMFDQQSIYTAVKKVKHTQGLDVLIVDSET